jgi:hypothetical protein
MSKINPFGKEAPVRSAVDILQENFGIGVRPYDRGVKEWRDERIDPESGEDKGPGFVHVPDLTTEVVIEFSTNEGKGTGRQAVPASEFDNYVTSLEQITKAKYVREDGAGENRYIPCGEVASSSWRMVKPKVKEVQSDGTTKSVTDQSADPTIVSVRAAAGKGAKPMQVQQAEFPEVVSMLRGIADNLEAFQSQAWENYNAEKPETSDDDSSDDAGDSSDE